MQIEVGLNEENSKFVLAGSTNELLNNRRAKIYMKDYLKAKVVGNEIIIPYEEENQEKILTNIREMITKYGFEEIKSDQVEKTLKDYYQEEENFSVFSKQAYEIRNNNFDIEDFAEFTKSLTHNLKNRSLYKLQLLSAYHLAFSQNACNFSVPGAGKTSIVYGAYTYLKNLSPENPKHINKILIIGPLSSFGPWENEYEECFGIKAKSKRLSGGMTKQEKSKYLYSFEPAELTLMSYQSVSSVIDDLIYFIKKNKVMVVLDEAHKIKNTEGGIIADSVLSIGKYCKARVVLTGTPAPNGYEDLMNLFQFLWPSKQIIRFHKYQLKEMSENPQDKRVQELIDDISPYYIRIRKSDLRLPEAINHPPIITEMGSHQRQIYDFIEKNYMDYIIDKSDSSDIRGALIKARMVRLMQAATNPSLLLKPVDQYFNEHGLTDRTNVDDSEVINKIIKYKEIETPEKYRVVLKLVNDILNKGEKVIIWAIFNQNMKELQEFLKNNAIESRLLYGEVPVELDEKQLEYETRESIIRDFHEQNSKFSVIIANPFAVSESISLHKACHNAIYLERTFNAAQFIQSKDRIHRYGLKFNDKVNYFYVLSNDSIDQTVHERLEFKENRMNRIIENEPIPLFSLVDEDDFGYDDVRTLINNYVNRVKEV
ncbi:DEAD/DEAH box helicase [Paenibacillus lutimineralis]|uniref:DEAD/DEAH box helicase n=1 Tax=Paenibacillus lutimineralis TaxID=2707005 RepID=A0A3Q9I609_9BACL|nr:DEAD/DEAH box helicase [Paenibacillus lutimineralis]AZS13308.1 DEAD/DEAH box helicase [Paenibacillus lutimineralis]